MTQSWLSLAVTILGVLQIPLCVLLWRAGSAFGGLVTELKQTERAIADHAKQDEERFREQEEHHREHTTLIEMLRSRSHADRKDLHNALTEFYNALDSRLRRVETGK